MNKYCIYKKLPQIYGSQYLYDSSSNHYIFYPIKNVKRINVLRKEMNLISIEEYAAENNILLHWLIYWQYLNWKKCQKALFTNNSTQWIAALPVCACFIKNPNINMIDNIKLFYNNNKYEYLLSCKNNVITQSQAL